MRLADILDLPDGTEALIFDVDGVLLDSLRADYDLCVAAAKAVMGTGDWILPEKIREHFALEAEGFWDELVKDLPEPIPARIRAEMVARYNRLRAEASFDALPGARALIDAAKAEGLKVAVGSSNEQAVLERILREAGFGEDFAVVSGVRDGVAAKPAGDIYASAAASLGVAPARCAYLEDSIMGLTAGRNAGLGFAVAVSTGATTFAELEASGLADVVYDRFEPPFLRFFDGEPARKSIATPNDFVSHMIEHIAWRMGAGVDVAWRSNDWRDLGGFLGDGLRGFDLRDGAAASLGMIDDGAAEVLIDRDGPPGLDFTVHPSLPEDRVLGLRVEQMRAGRDLVALAEGVAAGLGARIVIRLCTFEDPHHSWEGVYRAIGITLNRLRAA
ncbi:MAG: HAD family hydrolase [Parvularculaceae bacterium]